MKCLARAYMHLLLMFLAMQKCTINIAYSPSTMKNASDHAVVAVVGMCDEVHEECGCVGWLQMAVY